ncbi:hypothetical protein AMAG_19863 [Allomyces macrogynus ATCC 38327]|uniref:Uncharacterized protein n=1 Tax=Allomyces macrogynus (strain ATCC 38327) TaxID=578462 RepID=A0A0L0T2B3_ALLM3|nr:hypothetical protein AMAG_19863 [Allomyces macrogynus ATCC 38327]|eukprot:KNE68800.1 hypothetical protein AMAG_19863 [Allomyces macrogynus ATCC 38327]
MPPPPGTPRYPNAAPTTAKHLAHPAILLRPARGLIIQPAVPAPAPAPTAPPAPRRARRITINDLDEDEEPPQRSPTSPLLSASPSSSPVAAAKVAENGRAKSPVGVMVIDDESPEPEERADAEAVTAELARVPVQEKADPVEPESRSRSPARAAPPARVAIPARASSSAHAASPARDRTSAQPSTPARVATPSRIPAAASPIPARVPTAAASPTPARPPPVTTAPSSSTSTPAASPGKSPSPAAPSRSRKRVLAPNAQTRVDAYPLLITSLNAAHIRAAVEAHGYNIGMNGSPSTQEGRAFVARQREMFQALHAGGGSPAAAKKRQRSVLPVVEGEDVTMVEETALSVAKLIRRVP